MLAQANPAAAPVEYAPTLLGAAVFVTGLLLGIAVAIAARWGARQGGRTRAVAAAAGQLIVVRGRDGRWEPLAVPPRFATLFAAPPRAGEPLPPWRAEVGAALGELAARADARLGGAASAECAVGGLRLRLAAGRLGDGDELLVTVGEAGADPARLNQFEAASLLSNGLAHDLLNVLNTLCLHADAGAAHVANPARVLLHLERVRAGGQRAAELVSLLRRQLRADGRGDGPPAPVSLGDAVREAVELLRPVFPRGTTLDLALARDAHVATPEPVHVHQVVLNLLLNAAQALEGRAAPRLRVALFTAPAPAGREAVLVVEDNGPGMPPEVRARCFDPYYSTRAERRGSGLGLAVVRMLVVDTLRGDVRVDDAPGGGARFTVRVPAIDVTPPAAARADGDGVDAGEGLGARA